MGNKIRLLLAGHVGKPYGGMSVNYGNLLASSLKEKVILRFVETSDGREIFSDAGKFSLYNIFNSLKIIIRFFIAIISFRPDIVQIGTAYGVSFLKHSILVLISRILNRKIV